MPVPAVAAAAPVIAKAVPAVIAAAGALGSTLLGMRSSDRANSRSHKYDDLNALLAVKDFEFNKDYTLNQYQYTANDMTKAGLNPLIMGSSAGSSSVSSGNINTGSSSVADFSAIGNLASSVLASKTQESVAERSSNTQKSVADKNAETQKGIAEDNLEFNREKLKSDSEIRKMELEIERQNSQAQILKAQADVIKAQAETRNIDVNTADTSYELEGRKSKGSFKDDGNNAKDVKSAFGFIKSNVKKLDDNFSMSPYNPLFPVHAKNVKNVFEVFDKMPDDKYYWDWKVLDKWLDRFDLTSGERSYARKELVKKLKR